MLHCDIHCVNFLLDGELNLKVGDLAAAAVDGGRPNSWYRRTHQLVRKERGKEGGGGDGEGREKEKGKEVSVASEVFALGSALYCMVVGHDLFEPELDYEADKEEIRRRISEREFPDVGGLEVLGGVVKKCWNLEYGDMQDVLEGIDAESRSGGGEGVS